MISMTQFEPALPLPVRPERDQVLKPGLSRQHSGYVRKGWRGQALITLLFFMIIAMTITSAAVVMMAANSLSGTKFQEGEIAYHIAGSGADLAYLKLLRDPSYGGEQNVSIGGGKANITVTPSGNTY